MSLVIAASVVTIGTQIHSAVTADKAQDNAQANANAQNNIASQQMALASKHYETMEELGREELQMQKDRLEDWEETFGGLEDNLASYFSELDPDDVRREGFEQEKLRHQDTVKQIKKQFGSIGNTGSNTEQLALAGATLQSSQNMATIDRKAEKQVASQQMEFLKVGLNKEAGIYQSVGNANANLQNTLGNAASSATGQATSALNQANSAQSDANKASGIRDQAVGGLLDKAISTGQEYFF